jgi:hypothetical protein
LGCNNTKGFSKELQFSTIRYRDASVGGIDVDDGRLGDLMDPVHHGVRPLDHGALLVLSCQERLMAYLLAYLYLRHSLQNHVSGI